jgi:uncharacterized lipoprotein YmbA
VTRTAPIAALAAAALAAACGGKIPETRYYQLAAPAAAQAPEPAGAAGAGSGGLVLVLEPLSADDAYQDERIVYRTSPYRIDYYQYHHWSASPGILIADYLEQALQRSGRFRAVVRELVDGAAAVLGGRVIAIEEVDESRTRWLGRVVVELTLKDAQGGAVLWTRELAETEPLTVQSPEGLARALSVAMSRIAAHAIPEIVAHARPEPGAADRKSREARSQKSRRQ